MICSSTSRTDNSVQAAHAEFKAYTYTMQCACKQVPVLKSPSTYDDIMRFNAHMNTQAMCLQVSCKIASAEFQLMLGLHNPAGCAPELSEGLLGNLLLCNEDEGVI